MKANPDFYLALEYGAERIVFTAPPYSTVGYTPRPPQKRDDPEVAEPCTVQVRADTLAEALERKDAIELWLEYAAARQTAPALTPVYVIFKRSATADEYRSELFGGRVELDGDTLKRGSWVSGILKLTIFWSRQPFWEGPEAELTLTNTSGSALGGLTIYDHDDGDAGHDNYAEIAGGDVLGELDAACRIEFTNTYNNATRVRRVYLGHAVEPDPASLVHMLEAEDGTGGTTQAAVTASGGSYQALTITGDNEQAVWTYTLTTAMLDALGDLPYKILVRWHNLPTGVTKARFALQYQGGTLWQQGEQKTLLTNAHLQDLGEIRLRALFAGGTRHPLTLALLAQKTGGGALDPDVLQLTALASYREYRPITYGLEYEARLVDDGLTRSAPTYTDEHATAGRVANYEHHALMGEPIRLRPGKTQRLYWWWDDMNADSGLVIARTALVQVHYRPRRRLP